MSSPVVSPPAVDTRPVDDILRDIDVSLSPRQRMHVEALKKSYKGGFRSPRSIYRDVPSLEEIKAENLDQNFSTKIADRADALIDWALSHVPERGGPRRSRQMKRMQRRAEAKRLEHATRKQQVHQAKIRKTARLQRHADLANKYREEARRLYGQQQQTTTN